MKKFILTLIVFAAATSAFAARPTGLRLGAGYSMDFYKADVDGSTLYGGGLGLDNTSFLGAYVEVGYDWALSHHSTICVGARFNTLFNGKLDNNNYIKGKDWSIGGQASNRSYIDIPIMYQFAFDLSKNVQLFIAAGPTANFWLNNNTVFASASNIQTKASSNANSVNWFKENIFSENFYNRINMSLGGQVGVYFYHVKAFVGYDQAVFNFSDKQYGKTSLGQLRIGAAYVF